MKAAQASQCDHWELLHPQGPDLSNHQSHEAWHLMYPMEHTFQICLTFHAQSKTSADSCVASGSAL